MSQTNSIQQSRNQSAFAIIAAGGDPSTRPETSSKRPLKLFDSAEYFYQQTILLEKAQRLLQDQQRMEEQSRETFEQACATMSEKYGTSSDQIKKLSHIHKEKKKFDSADYFMENQMNAQGTPLEETNQEEDIADRAMREQADKGETNFICCAKRNPLVPKSKKNFDSADFFMEEYGKNHPVSKQEWEEMLEALIKSTENVYNQSVLPQSMSSAQPDQQSESTPNAEPLACAIQIESQTDRIVQLQSERMVPLYILKKKKNPLINRGKSYYQFDSADYFMQQADAQNNTQTNGQQAPQKEQEEEINVDASIKMQADICERHYILKKKTIILKVADAIKKRKEFDSADYFMQRAASSSSSDNSISED